MTPIKEQITPTRRSHTAILGAARNRFSNRTSGTSHTTDYLTHSPGSSIQSHHVVMTPGRQNNRDWEAGQHSLEDIPEVKSMASDPSLRKKDVDRRSIDSTTSASSLERMMLEVLPETIRQKASRRRFFGCSCSLVYPVIWLLYGKACLLLLRSSIILSNELALVVESMERRSTSFFLDAF
jgi:hypothetical protein